MARIAKSLVAPSHGYRHRDHRTNKSPKSSPLLRKIKRSFKLKVKAIEEDVDYYDARMGDIRLNW
jgi:hypothetical protein